MSWSRRLFQINEERSRIARPSQGENLTCITDHPGFNPVCLQKMESYFSFMEVQGQKF